MMIAIPLQAVRSASRLSRERHCQHAPPRALPACLTGSVRDADIRAVEPVGEVDPGDAIGDIDADRIGGGNQLYPVPSAG